MVGIYIYIIWISRLCKQWLLKVIYTNDLRLIWSDAVIWSNVFETMGQWGVTRPTKTSVGKPRSPVHFCWRMVRLKDGVVFLFKNERTDLHKPCRWADDYLWLATTCSYGHQIESLSRTKSWVNTSCPSNQKWEFHWIWNIHMIWVMNDNDLCNVTRMMVWILSQNDVTCHSYFTYIM